MKRDNMGRWLFICSALGAAILIAVSGCGGGGGAAAPACSISITGVQVPGVSPPRICEGGGEMIIAGTGIKPGAAATLSLSGGVSLTALSNAVSNDGTTLTATFGPGLLADAMRYTLTVTNPGGCQAMISDAVLVTSGIVTLSVDPGVAYNGVNNRLTALVTGLDPLGSGPAEVRLIHSITGNVISFTGSDIDWGGTDTQPRPQRVRIVVPSGTPAGTYSVGINDGTGCIALLQNALTMVSQTSLALTTVSPAFGFKDEDASITLSGVGFAAVPRIFVSPSGGGGAATEVRAVRFIDATTVTAVVPNHSMALAAGDYDIIAVNPAGEVGVLASGYRVTQLPPPAVTNVSPGTLVNANPSAPLVVNGSNFRSPAVGLTCRALLATTPVTLSATVTSSTSTLINATVDMAALSVGMVCVVRVTNGDDGSYHDFSAVAVANPSQGANALNFNAGASLATARRAPAVAGARSGRTSRFLYAIGGDDGTTAGAFSSVEAAPAGPWGDLGAWFTVPGGIAPAKRTLAKAVSVGSFLYLIGGNDSTGPTSSTLRAQILDPSEAPVVSVAPDLAADDQSGADQAFSGDYSYRVSAVLADTQTHNPGGETLASDAVMARVPLVGMPVIPRICWMPLAQPAGVEVAKYRIYRTVTAGQGVGQEKLLTECPGSAGCTTSPPNCFDDTVTDASGFADATRPPLPPGSTGVWHAGPAMSVARASAGVAVVPFSPGNAAIYAVGGTSDGTNGLAHYEYLVVNTDGTFGGGTWTSGATNNLAVARHGLDLFVASSVNAPKVMSDIWVYAGPGRATAASITNNVTAARVDPATGNLEAWIEAVDDDGTRAGYAAAVSNDFLFLIGGTNGSPSSDGANAAICAAGQGGACAAAPSDPPDLANWNAAAVASPPRSCYLAGHVALGAFWYLIGGQTGTEAASATTDYSPLGGQP